ncbi:hypothetical protein Lalb_Chr05g0224201 [Lupinus albus]|uniref:Avr9/Cf-9 rapidly elicited protein n=1 Tax=Lupinus albus TaxID=3870 RepID=A0A6A4QJF5_LUPAL|nr:hypothetical protein Lalb_Chr05g0224201 [Lupinus albus]
MEKSKFSKANTSVWDCGSTLYDSYELNSFKSQLSSAIANSPRSLSMPHFTQRYHHQDFSLNKQQPPPPPSSLNHCMFNNKSFKISRSFQKLLRFVFKGNKLSKNSNSLYKVKDNYSKEGCFYVVYDKSDQPVLSTIPELPEFEIGGLSPETSSSVTKSASERFSAIFTGISCA